MNYNYKRTLPYFISFVISLPILICFGLGIDEPFTMGLINHSYTDIISLSKLDIHPPFYYIILKFFICATSFWTKNIFVHIFFARLLSFIFSIIAYLCILKLLKNLSIKSQYISPIIFVLILSQQLTYIRMYSLCLMLICAQMLYLIKLYDDFNYKYPVILFILTTLSMYTHYFAGMIAGLLIIFFSITLMIEKAYNKSISLITSGLLSILAFIPWIPSLIHQLKLQPKNINTTPFNIHAILASIVPIILVFIMFLICKNKLNHKASLILGSSALVIAIVYISLLIINRSTTKYVFPILAPYIFVTTTVLLNKTFKFKKIIIAVIFITLFARFSHSLDKQIKTLDIPSISFMKQLNSIKENKNKDINIHSYGLDKYFWDKKYGGGGGNAIYLESIDKKINDKNYINTYQVLGNGNARLFNSIFPNIEHFTTNNPGLKQQN